MIKKIFIGIAVIGLLLLLIKRSDMNWRQSLMKTFYPVIRKSAELSGSKSSVLINTKHAQPIQSFYSLSAISIDGKPILFDQLKGKKVLLVNTASSCGYTGQLEELQRLHEKFAGRLVVIGFPANDYKDQERGTNEEIAAFCKENYGVTFTLVQKTSVVKGGQQHEVFSWLTDKHKNGWNETAPSWNFGKYLVDESGVLVGFFDTSISPFDERLVGKIY